jgi:type I restriction enzyme R subunit
MQYGYSEDSLVEQPAIELFKELGWEAANCYKERFGSTLMRSAPSSFAPSPQPSPKGRGGTAGISLGRETTSEVVLVSRLRPMLERLNPDAAKEAIDDAIEQLTRHRRAMTPAQANREIYKLIKNGVRVMRSAPSPQPSPKGRGSQAESTTPSGSVPSGFAPSSPTLLPKGEGSKSDEVERIRVIDWDNPESNDFFLASQFWITGDMYKRRTDLIGFVNGLPLVFIELKKLRIEHAFKHNLRDYKNTIPQLFWYNSFIILSNGSKGRIGSITGNWDHFTDWNRISDEEEPGIVSLETMIRGTCEPRRLLDLVENFALFSERKGGLQKLVAMNHQYLGVNKAIAALQRIASFAPSPLAPLPGGEGRKSLDAEGQIGTTPSSYAPSPQPSPKGRGSKTSPSTEADFKLRGSKARQYRGGYEFAGLVDRARELRKKQTTAEALLWELLRNRQLFGFKFRRQHQFGDYIADFYCHEAQLVVECDGSAHAPNEAWHHDQERDAYMIEQGLRVLRFKNDMILNDTESVLEQIAACLPSPSGRRAGEEGLQTKPDVVNGFLPSPTGRGAGGEGAKLGVFWHTQGSGKSFSMVFFSQKILRKLPGNWTFVIVTDRDDLDDQIYKNFARCGAVTEPEKTVRAQSSEHLRQLLSENHRYVFTLIQKFRVERGQVHPMVSDRSDIIVITDEAHRSQYDQLALNMRNALPNAAFIGFTGTPLMAGEERTKEVFGDYVSIYNFKQSVDDHATVPLFYENRIPELQLVNENLNDEMAELIEDAGLSEDQEKKLEREFTREYHLITRDERLERIAADIVEHFTGRGFQGKAMVISIDKATAVRMYDKVQKYWNQHLGEFEARLSTCVEPERSELEDKIKFMGETDMAVVVSQSQNEVEDLAAKGANIVPHRRRMNKEDLDEKFKDDKDPLRIAFVCAMWITGFDVESCSTIYLDKPMKNHTLMQTIARANRVFPDKVNGLIVDYVGVFRNLEKALAIYAGSPSGLADRETPVKDKESLVALLRGAIADVTEFCKDHGVDPHAIAFAPGFGRVKLIDDAVEAIVVNDESKRRYLTLESNVWKLYKAILPDFLANQFYPTCSLFRTIADKIKAEAPEIDISEIISGVDELLDRSVAAEAYVIHEAPRKVDLSKIDFDALQKRFTKGRKRIEAEKLKASLSVKLAKMILENKTRMDFLEKFQRMIEEYNSGAINVEVFFAKLVEFTQELNEEDRRTIAEQLSDEELAIFDLLTKPQISLTKKETDQVKNVARELLAKLKQEKLVLDWRAKQQARAGVQLTIQDSLEELPRSYSRPLYAQKCELIYQHVYDSYFGSGQSVYSRAA